VLAAVAAGKHVVLCTLLSRTCSIVHYTDSPHDTGGHTNTERGYLPVLATKLQAELKKFQQTDTFASYADTDQEIVRQLEVHVSVEDRHPLQFV
jgi:hypothetical protein